ncbi:DUF4222 domain-containing protein [Xenorhabdus szentirmaii]|uniref:DUF4222 domain-containing protein n=1 Tax=Xenorhabdus szentirmaii TaxID=290112 RepID=A0AAW3YTD7_9GAMM|nr:MULTISPECIES: DUF4222 domain-containing protein [unclassified Xenorhabdus]MBD2800329.1 DUF4222 domain-containing protein [Xenorhabdus sp. M]MBD2826801.1 DUF4222 domain-containing protein [Xenorhabdus sp. 5]
MRNPAPHDYYTHKNGDTVQVLSIAFNRVTFVREGYSTPCIMPVSRFTKEYTYAGRA